MICDKTNSTKDPPAVIVMIAANCPAEVTQVAEIKVSAHTGIPLDAPEIQMQTKQPYMLVRLEFHQLISSKFICLISLSAL